MTQQPVLIIGAGVSGLLLAQHLQSVGVSYRLFERDTGLSTRGVGWGLTLHWSLPALKELLPEHLTKRLPETYADRASVERGDASRFPAFDLSTGKVLAESPKLPEWQRIRVTREALRRLLATDLNIEWGKSLLDMQSNADSITAAFEDGSTATGSLLVACDGVHSRARHILFGDLSKNFHIPVRVMGVKLTLTPEQVAPIRACDPFLFQGNNPENDTFLFYSLLDAPGNTATSTDNYVCQMCVSWPYRPGFLGNPDCTEVPETNAERYQFMQKIGATWAEPFRTLVQSVTDEDAIKGLEPIDFPPPRGLHSIGRVALMGDAMHAMAMFRGEGANHVIVDVKDFVEIVLPTVRIKHDYAALRTALDKYEHTIIERTRPAVLASRQACLDAHDHTRINKESPLFTKREMFTPFKE